MIADHILLRGWRNEGVPSIQERAYEMAREAAFEKKCHINRLPDWMSTLENREILKLFGGLLRSYVLGWSSILRAYRCVTLYITLIWFTIYCLFCCVVFNLMVTMPSFLDFCLGGDDECRGFGLGMCSCCKLYVLYTVKPDWSHEVAYVWHGNSYAISGVLSRRILAFQRVYQRRLASIDLHYLAFACELTP